MNPTKERLENLYVIQGLTETEIGKKLGCSQTQVGRLRKKFGIPTIENRSSLGLPELTEQQKELLVGSLMGDGYMRVGSSPLTAAFDETHGPKQYDYLQWKAEIMGAYTNKVIDCMKVSNGKEYPSRRLTTRMCTQLRPYYDLFYNSKGKRVFPANLKDLMTPFILAVWYMDDGSLNRYAPRITFGLDDLSLSRAIKALRKLGLRPVVHEDRRGVCCSIEFPSQSDKFFDLVRPHIPDCMSYKLPVESARRDTDRNAKRLTPEKAMELYEGGMTHSRIAEVYDVGVSTVRRRIAAVGKPKKKMGRPRKAWSVRSAQVELSTYDSGAWSQLDATGKQSGLEYVLGVLRHVPFPFPETETDLLRKDFEKLKALKVFLDDGEIRPRSYTGIKACSSFFHNRFKAKYRGKTSAFEAWYDPKHLSRAIEWQLRVGDPVTPQRVLKAVTANCRTPTVFRPGVAKYLYETHCPKGGVVWDPCSGYGGRLLGAAAAGVRYIGTDVEAETVKGNLALRDALKLKKSHYKVVRKAAETYDPGPVDMVFTSPPYFNVEHYSGQSQQSYKQFDQYDKWLKGFLEPVMKTAYHSLPDDGVFALNVANIKIRKGILNLVKDATSLALGCGFVQLPTIIMPLATLNASRKGEPVLLFRKPPKKMGRPSSS